MYFIDVIIFDFLRYRLCLRQKKKRKITLELREETDSDLLQGRFTLQEKFYRRRKISRKNVPFRLRSRCLSHTDVFSYRYFSPLQNHIE